MAIAVNLERDVPGVDANLFSEALFAEMDALSDLAELAGVSLLASFTGVDPVQSLGFDNEECPALPVEWFDASEALRSVEAILAALRAGSADLGEEVLADLGALRCILEAARDAGVRFNLEVVL